MEPELASSAEEPLCSRKHGNEGPCHIPSDSTTFLDQPTTYAGNLAPNKGKSKAAHVLFPSRLSQLQAGGYSTAVKCVHNKK